MSSARNILLLAAENGALPHGKVGGVGDVMRELPIALARRGLEPVVLTPAYGLLDEFPDTKQIASVNVGFGGVAESVDLYEIPLDPDTGVRHCVLDHACFQPNGPGIIYCDDGDDAPFETDGGKFAFFCAAAAAAICEGALEAPDVVHLHDWPAALFLALREFDPVLSPLKKIRTVYTIHNLALQGVRPLDGYDSSLHAWFPHLTFETETVADPRWEDCVNPMAAAIRLADGVNTVSSVYAEEITRPSAPERGYSGGEGLEEDLGKAQSEGRLAGILNGCEYPEQPAPAPEWSRVVEVMQSELMRWQGEQGEIRAHARATERLDTLSSRRPGILLTSIGRIATQKVQLLREEAGEGGSALATLLESLGDDAWFIMLGTGDPDCEAFLADHAAVHPNFLYLQGYSDELSDLLYRAGDLFLMPSQFEPCGISQMIAMRAGQPCVVHGVGGLKETVEDDVTGFTFGGDTPRMQAASFLDRVREALELRRSSPERWEKICRAAAAARFDWDASAAKYEQVLYESGHA
ncbi:MAG: glycogen/starch synthase [Gammaproteobacteria bacterium]|nr:glycogen/starch synthase [Gammaproteobacteria bacterium]